MSPIAWPSGAWAWPHLQRLAQRGLRRWGYAFAGWALGLGGMWLAQPEVGESYASALQAHARLAQQLADLRPSAAGATPEKVAATDVDSGPQAQRLFSQLPVSTRPDNLWAAWQQILATHDLRLVFLQPMPSNGPVGRGDAGVSHAAAWRVVGRFDDWVRVWAACAESGPVCALERISVVATPQPGEVQMDAVMRVWMRSAEGPPSDALALADWVAAVQQGARPSAHSRTALFAPSGSSAADLQTTQAVAQVPPTGAAGRSAGEAGVSALPDDPRQWPWARIRLAGLWRHGDERQAFVSAGAHAVKVTQGQRISLEGHRVAAITDLGVHVRLGKGPALELPWADTAQVGGSGGLSAGVMAGVIPGVLPGPSKPSIHPGLNTGSSPP
ncbi:hypothetical protein [Limnohabitans sp. G3-2]|uniref:hypothetical protein n=1 Tax=Limnohabitans sp. G3-2 TaxID=1100711 RepID=UPI000C1EAB6A|nr:hypothetical protein [Limnohabitans sp. G3-2]PIT74093.1 hypothetical protein B9Z31_09625 [Limnohabitans sp. G3-2]